MAIEQATTEQNKAEFRKSYPIDFQLLDPDDQAVLYISEDNDDWKLRLQVKNTSSQTIEILNNQTPASGIKDPASRTNHHFALRFKPGTLAKSTLNLLASDQVINVVTSSTSPSASPSMPEWVLAPIAQPAINQDVILYLLYTGTELSFIPGEAHTIELSGLHAAPGVGSRGTQVELLPHQLQFAGSQTPITASRTQYMHITNHRGRKNIPLHVGVVEGNRLLPGDSGIIKLKITNTDKTSTMVLKGQQTYLTLSCDEEDHEWGLGKIKSVTVDGFEAKNSGQATKNEWVYVTPANRELKYGEGLDITVNLNPVSAHAGLANLCLNYKIPGYWDGQFICSIEKGPIVIESGNVGIGKNPGDTKLHVEGTLTATGEATLERLILTHAATTAEDANAGGALVIGGGNLRLGHTPEGAGFIQTHSGKPLLINQANNVGIGMTGTPTETLEVHGSIKQISSNTTGLIFKTNNDGNPGIFTLGATKGLTITTGDLGNIGGNIPNITLGTNELIVLGRIICNDFWQYPSISNDTTLKRWHEFTPIAYRKDPQNNVHIRGALFSSWDEERQAWAFLFQLAEGYRPKPYKDVTVRAMDKDWKLQTCSLQIETDGWVKIGENGINANIRLIFLDGINFLAE